VYALWCSCVSPTPTCTDFPVVWIFILYHAPCDLSTSENVKDCFAHIVGSQSAVRADEVWLDVA
jgi:hypothetical protein